MHAICKAVSIKHYITGNFATRFLWFPFFSFTFLFMELLYSRLVVFLWAVFARLYKFLLRKNYNFFKFLNIECVTPFSTWNANDQKNFLLFADTLSKSLMSTMVYSGSFWILLPQSLSNSHEETTTPNTHYDVRKAKMTPPLSNSLNPKVIETLNLACGLLFDKFFQKNWFWFDDVIIVTSWPTLVKIMSNFYWYLRWFKFCTYTRFAKIRFGLRCWFDCIFSSYHIWNTLYSIRCVLGKKKSSTTNSLI